MPARPSLLDIEGAFARKVQYDYLFEMEMWLKGLESYFVIENLPLASDEYHRLSLRNYVEDVAVVHDVLSHVAQVASRLLGEGREDFANFILYLEHQIAGPMPDTGRRTTRIASAEADLAKAIEKIEDLIRLAEELQHASYIARPSYISLGRIVIGFLRDDRNLGGFFQEDLFPVFDRSDKQHLQRILKAIEDRRARRELATLFVGLFKGLRYVDATRQLITKASGRRRAMVLFTLVRSLTERIMEYVRQRLEEDSGSSRRTEALDAMAFATDMEMRKVMEVELVDVVRLKDSRAAQEKMENGCGILRDLFQQNILSLVEAYAPDLDGYRFFPEYITKKQQSVRLRNDLWKLVRSCRQFQEVGDRAALDRFLGDLSDFRHGSMRYLMFKDWNSFERFAQGFLKERAMRTYLSAAHQFEIFLKTLVREVSKRQVLADVPFRAPEATTTEIPRPDAC